MISAYGGEVRGAVCPVGMSIKVAFQFLGKRDFSVSVTFKQLTTFMEKRMKVDCYLLLFIKINS